MSSRNLPNDEQRRLLCDLMAEAFTELRYFTGDQAHDLAYAFHNLPKEIYGWGSWSAESARARLQHYQSKYQDNVGFRYVDAFNAIFPPVA